MTFEFFVLQSFLGNTWHLFPSFPFQIVLNSAVNTIENVASWWDNTQIKSVFVQSVETIDNLVCEMKITQSL